MVAERGWATNEGEWEQSVVAVATAIELDDGLRAAVLVSTLPARMYDGRAAELGAAVAKTAEAIGRAAASRTVVVMSVE